MANYLKSVVTAAVPQSEPLNERQLANSAGGYSYPVDDWVRLNRFLVLGSEGGSYYASERKLTKENIGALDACLRKDFARTINTIREISESGRAPRNDEALFALAYCAGVKPGNGFSEKDAAEAHSQALAALPKIARIGTHLFQFMDYVQLWRGWGPALRRAIADWYLRKDPAKLAYQVIKYQQRLGWNHRDVLRLSHPKAGFTANNDDLVKDGREAILHWIVKGWSKVGALPHPNPVLQQLWAFERAKGVRESEVAKLIVDYELPWECVPTEMLRSPRIWEALLQNMPLTAMIRNLGNMTEVGLVGPNSEAAKLVCQKLDSAENLRRARVHPIQVLINQVSYLAGCGVKGSKTWTPVPVVRDAMERAFYASFHNVEPTGKRWYLALDVSASMTTGRVAGVPNLTPRIAAAALAMLAMRTEKQYVIAGFTSGSRNWLSGAINDLALRPTMSLTEAVRYADGLAFGGTDCSLPMLDAMSRKIPVDIFAVYTDSETYAGEVHACEALRQYRQKMGIAAKLAVVGMVSNGFTIADPVDAGMLDVVGMDAATPRLLADFATDGQMVAAEEEAA